MTELEFKKVKLNTKLYAWFSYEEGAVAVEACDQPHDNHIKLKRLDAKNGENVIEVTPLSHVFTDVGECEKHCLLTEEEFNSYMESFQDLHAFFAHLLLNSAVGHTASEGELDALAHRTTLILGCNGYKLLSDYSNIIFEESEKDEKGTNDNG